MAVPVRVFCTYFDAQYLSRGLALYRSLQAHAGPFRLFVLCLDDLAYDALAAHADIVRIRMDDFERRFPDLVETKKTRSSLEYYFTCTPAVIRYVFDQSPDVRILTYLDADLYFFSTPDPLYEELGAGTVGIIEHRFPAELRRLEEYGRFNVGWVTFKREPEALQCLDRWHGQCVEWCHDLVEPERFADQKYLDQWPRLLAGVRILGHKGANVAPWNVGQYRIREISGRVFVDEAPLVFYHFHGLRYVRPGAFASGLAPYSAEMTPALRRHVYRPYIRMLLTYDHQRGLSRGTALEPGPPSPKASRKP